MATAAPRDMQLYHVSITASPPGYLDGVAGAGQVAVAMAAPRAVQPYMQS